MIESGSPLHDDQEALAAAVAVLRRGGVVAHATEGVWGLACDPLNANAVVRIVELKGRSASKGLIVIAGSDADFEAELAELEPTATERIRRSWPGAVTWILPTSRFPAGVTGGRKTIAARVPDHAQSRALASTFGGPIVSTSANRTGETPCRSEAQVLETLGAEVDYVLSGTLGNRAGRPSQIIDARTGATLR